jgi:predicted phosphohydrolase
VRYFAIADLHLSFSHPKPMNLFGELWDNHEQKIEHTWGEMVHPGDVVLIAGDISWAMTLPDAMSDLEWIAQLPGQKVMIRGNHDYWWSGIGKIRSSLPPGVYALQNDAISFGDVVVCGSRGWQLPSHPSFTGEDERLYSRELERLRLSLDYAESLPHKTKVVLLHYPPLSADGQETAMTRLLEQHGVSLCVYGHLHAHAHRYAYVGDLHGIQYQLVSADYVNFQPILLPI